LTSGDNILIAFGELLRYGGIDEGVPFYEGGRARQARLARQVKQVKKKLIWKRKNK